MVQAAHRKQSRRKVSASGPDRDADARGRSTRLESGSTRWNYVPRRHAPRPPFARADKSREDGPSSPRASEILEAPPDHERRVTAPPVIVARVIAAAESRRKRACSSRTIGCPTRANVARGHEVARIRYITTSVSGSTNTSKVPRRLRRGSSAFRTRSRIAHQRANRRCRERGSRSTTRIQDAG